MTKTIRVIKTDKGYVERHEYSQGCSSYSVTDNPLAALDLNEDPSLEDFTWRCMIHRHETEHPTIETYRVTVERL